MCQNCFHKNILQVDMNLSDISRHEPITKPVSGDYKDDVLLYFKIDRIFLTKSR